MVLTTEWQEQRKELVHWKMEQQKWANRNNKTDRENSRASFSRGQHTYRSKIRRKKKGGAVKVLEETMAVKMSQIWQGT